LRSERIASVSTPNKLASGHPHLLSVSDTESWRWNTVNLQLTLLGDEKARTAA
jgi:hypothetical protein